MFLGHELKLVRARWRGAAQAYADSQRDMQVIRVYGDVPTSHVLFDVRLTPDAFHGQLLATMTSVHQAARTIDARVADEVYYLLLHWAERFIYGDGDGGDGDVTVDEDDTDDNERMATPVLLQPTRASPRVVVLTKGGVLHCAEVRANHHLPVIWRHASSLLATDRAHRPTLYSVRVQQQPMVLASSLYASLLLDIDGTVQAAMRWSYPGNVELLLGDSGDDVVRIVREESRALSIYELKRRPSASLRTFLIFIISMIVVVLIGAMILAATGKTSSFQPRRSNSNNYKQY